MRWALLFASLLLAGCAQIQDWLQLDRRNSDSGGKILGAPTPEHYLDFMYRMIDNDPTVRAETFAEASAAIDATPGPASRLRLALVLSVPGHEYSDLARAQEMFHTLLADVELLTATERALTTIHLRELEQRQSLSREAEHLRADAAEAATSEREALERKLAGAEQERESLRRSLAEAEAKLEAITSIERSIREQAENNQPD